MNLHQKFFSKIGFNYFILAISIIILQIITVNIIGLINIKILDDFNILTIISSICSYILPFPIILFLMRKIEINKLEKQNINLKTFITFIAISFTLMWIGNIIGLIITFTIGSITQTDITNPVQNLINSSNIWLNLVIISIIGPIFEEIFFRKFLIDRTIKYGAKVSIILSAVIFSFFHGNLNQFFYAFLMGGFLAYVYIKTGNITYSIILHIITNFMGSVVSLLVSNSGQSLASGNFTFMDLAIVLIYLTIIIISAIIGTIGIIKLRTDRFNGSKTQISLKTPIKTMIVNPGMFLFILFCICEIIFQII